MKRIILSLFILFLFASAQEAYSQVLTESAKRKVTVGVDLFTDYWFNVPNTVTQRNLNKGTNVYMTYNIPVGNSKTTTFGIGLGIGNHNLNLKDGQIDDVKSDVIDFVPIGTGLTLKNDKLTVTYAEVPMQLKLRGKKGFKWSVGLKISYLIDSKQKYVGTLVANGPERKIKSKGVYNLSTFGYSPEIRFGYKSLNLYVSYQLVSLFKVGHGPELHPISAGITITPF